MKKILLKIMDNFELYICCFTIVLSLIVLFMQVILRYVFSNATSWSEEVGRYCLIYLIFLGTSLAAKNEAHIRIDAAINLWPEKIRGIILELGDVVWFAFNVLIIYVSIFYTREIFQMGSIAPGLKIPLGFVYMAIPMGFTLMCIRMIVLKVQKFLRRAEGRKEDKE